MENFDRITTGDTSGSGTAFRSWAPEFTIGFYWDLCCPLFRFLCSV